MAEMLAPRVGCAMIIRDDQGGVLLGRRAKEPFFGAWVLPGGGVYPFEPYQETAKREAKEELGLDISVDSLRTVAEIINPPKEHRIILYVNCTMLSGRIAPSSDISDARFFSKKDVQQILNANQSTPTVSAALREIFSLKEPACKPASRRRAA